MQFEDLGIPDDRKFFLYSITNLKLGSTYKIQVRWKYADGTYGPWSGTKTFNTPILTNPNDPSLPTENVVGGAGFIKVTWDGNDASGNPLQNIDRIDVHISGTSFGDGTKPAGSFKSSGTQTFAAEPGIYIVQLKAVTVNGATSFFSTARTVTVTSAAEPIEAPTNPNGFSSRRILAGIEVSWAGTYSNGTFSGFEAIKVFAGTSASATAGTYTEVGVLTGNNVKNTIVVPVDGTYVAYGQPVYIHAAAVNKNGTVGTIQANVTNQSLGPGRATDADINDGAVVISKLASDVLTVGNLKAGDINSTSFIRAGTSGSARVEISSSTVGSVLPGLTVYDSGNSQILRAPLTGGLSITGSLAATQISTSSGKFSVNTSGILNASDVDLTGTIKASGGNIGGIVIASDGIQNSANTFKLDNGGKARFGSSSGNAIIIDPAAGVGSAYIYHSTNGGSSASGKFTVKTDGTLEATGVKVSGEINASSGTFSGSITATGTISGGILSGATISGGLIRTGSSGQRIIISGSDQAINPNAITFINSSGSPMAHIVPLDSFGLLMHYGGTADSSGGTYPQLFVGSGNVSMSARSGGAGTSGGLVAVSSSGVTLQASGGENISLSGGTVTFGTTTGQVMEYLNSNGNLRIGSNITRLQADGQIFANTLGTSSGTTIVQSSTGFLKVLSSSKRYKENIVEIDKSGYLDLISLLKPVKFNYKQEVSPDDYQITLSGLIAEDVDEISELRTIVNYNLEGVPESISYNGLSALLVLAIKEIKDKIENIEQRLDALEG